MQKTLILIIKQSYKFSTGRRCDLKLISNNFKRMYPAYNTKVERECENKEEIGKYNSRYSLSRIQGNVT